MNLVYFIRLIVKNLLLILGVAIAMAILVYVMTRGQPKTYSTNSTVYTGIATGYNLESGSNSRFDLFSNNAKFDNLINIIKSRETQEMTAIRLMAQHLVLTNPDPNYCLPETWRKLMGEVPVEIKLLVERSYQPDPQEVKKDFVVPKVADTVPKSQTIVEKVRHSKTKPQYYTIKAGDSPSSICIRFGITLEQFQLMNSPMPPFQGGQRVLVGNATEYYMADTTITKTVPAIIGEYIETDTAAGNVAGEVPVKTPAVKKPKAVEIGTALVSPENLARYERLVKAMTGYKDADQSNYLFRTLQSKNIFYSVSKISGVKVSRIQSSDLLMLTYDSNDPAVCVQTLRILTEVFKSEYQSITTTQTGQVSEYFNQRVNSAKRQLDSLEQCLLTFRQANKIINYDEQTKFISEQKELLDKDWYLEAGVLSAAKTALALLEENLGEKGKLVLQNNSILEMRQQVYELAFEISAEEIKNGINIDSLTILKGKLERLKLRLNNEVLKSFETNRTIQGLNIQNVLQKWLEKAIEVEESQAKFTTLTERKNAFLKKYDEFAPLGSQLKKLEREISLAQADYLNHLNNLNQSIMKQKNVEQSDIQIIDSPVYPIKPNASKRMITIIASFMAGLILTAALIILLEFLDTSIKFPERMEELSGFPLLGAYPKVPDALDSSANYPLICSRAIDQIAQRIYLEDLRQKDQGDKPFILFMVSTRENEGKSFLAVKIVEKLRAGGSRVLYIKPAENGTPVDIRRQFTSFNQSASVWDFEYQIPDSFINVRNVNDLLRNYAFITKGYSFIVIELPALLHQEYPATLVESGNLSVLVGRATRTWNKADSDAVQLYHSAAMHKMMSLLNACHVDQLESIIGEIPKRRSFLRKMVKRLINLDFKRHEIA